MIVNSLESLEERMGNYWFNILSTPVAKEIKNILASGDKKLYALWLCQVAHLTKHTSAHQALVGTRFEEISVQYMKFCYEHALEEVGHELMAVNDLKKIGTKIENLKDLPPPLQSTEQLTAYLYYAAQRAHPATRLGFSFWAEKCYPFIQSLAGETQKALGLKDHQMTFFVSHSKIDEKHALDVEKVIGHVCKTEEDWKAVETGMISSLDLAIRIFEEILSVTKESQSPAYEEFLKFTEAK